MTLAPRLLTEHKVVRENVRPGGALRAGQVFDGIGCEGLNPSTTLSLPADRGLREAPIPGRNHGAHANVVED